MTITYFHHSQLARWPGQMRRRYEPSALQSMAESQRRRAAQGLDPCIQPVIVTPGPGQPFKENKQPLYVVAGSRRWEGNKLLGPKAPTLNCVVRFYPDENAMLADMRTENGQRVDPSPLEWAEHFRVSLKANPQLSQRELAEESGKTVNQVNALLWLTELPPAVQDLYDAGDLPLSSLQFVRRLKHSSLLIRAAKSWARKGFSNAQIEKAVKTLLLARKPKPAKSAKPLHPATAGLSVAHSATLQNLREAAAVQCAGCSVNQFKIKEPAWHAMLAAANGTCAACDLRQTPAGCEGCPLPEMLQRLAGGQRGN